MRNLSHPGSEWNVGRRVLGAMVEWRLATRNRGWGAILTGAALVGREQMDKNASGRKREIQALLLRFLW